MRRDYPFQFPCNGPVVDVSDRLGLWKYLRAQTERKSAAHSHQDRETARASRPSERRPKHCSWRLRMRRCVVDASESKSDFVCRLAAAREVHFRATLFANLCRINVLVTAIGTLFH